MSIVVTAATAATAAFEPPLLGERGVQARGQRRPKACRRERACEHQPWRLRPVLSPGVRPRVRRPLGEGRAARLQARESVGSAWARGVTWSDRRHYRRFCFCLGGVLTVEAAEGVVPPIGSTRCNICRPARFWGRPAPDFFYEHLACETDAKTYGLQDTVVKIRSPPAPSGRSPQWRCNEDSETATVYIVGLRCSV